MWAFACHLKTSPILIPLSFSLCIRFFIFPQQTSGKPFFFFFFFLFLILGKGFLLYFSLHYKLNDLIFLSFILLCTIKIQA